MKDENPTPQPWIDPALEARIVASVLGETSAFEAAEIERLVAANPELALFKRRIEVTHGHLKAASQPQDPKLQLSPERRRKLLETIGVPAVAPPKKVHVIAAPSPWWSSPLMVRAAACLIMIGLAVALLSSITEFRQSQKIAGAVEGYATEFGNLPQNGTIVTMGTVTSSADMQFELQGGEFVPKTPAIPAQPGTPQAPSAGEAYNDKGFVVFRKGGEGPIALNQPPASSTAPMLGDVPVAGRLFRGGQGAASSENRELAAGSETDGTMDADKLGGAPLELAKADEKPQKRRMVSSWNDELRADQAAGPAPEALAKAEATLEMNRDKLDAGSALGMGSAKEAEYIQAEDKIVQTRPTPKAAGTPVPGNEQAFAQLAERTEKLVDVENGPILFGDGTISTDKKGSSAARGQKALEKQQQALASLSQAPSQPLDLAVGQIAQVYGTSAGKDRKANHTELQKSLSDEDVATSGPGATTSTPTDFETGSSELFKNKDAKAAPDDVSELARQEVARRESRASAGAAAAAVEQSAAKPEEGWNSLYMYRGVNVLEAGQPHEARKAAADMPQAGVAMPQMASADQIMELQTQLQKKETLVEELREQATKAAGNEKASRVARENLSILEAELKDTSERAGSIGTRQTASANSIAALDSALAANSNVVAQPVFSTRDGKPVEFDGYVNYGSPIRTVDAPDAQNKEELKRLLEEGKGFQETGRYDLAAKRFAQSLDIDKYNIAARKGLEEVNAAKTKYYTNAYNETRSRMLWEVDQSWERPVRRFENGRSTSVGSGNRTGARSTEAIVSKLNRIIIPRLDVQEATVRDVVDFLKQRSKDLDTTADETPEKKGVSIVMKLEDAQAPDPAASASPSAPLPMHGGNENTRITLSLTNVSLIEALKYVTELSGLKYKIDPYAVSIVPLAESCADLVTKEYLLPPGFLSKLPASATQTKIEASSGKNSSANIEGTIKTFLEKSGVPFPAGAFARYIPSANKLIVRNTSESVDLVDSLVDSTGPAPIAQAFGDEIATSKERFSTFSLHVSDVSFQLAKDALARGVMPDPSRIRAEEFYNAFDYNDPAPGAGEEVACRIEQSAHPFLQQRNLARIAIKVASAGRAAGQPLRLTVLLDTSGSMEREDRAASVRRALQSLVSLLGPNDRVTLIGFARTPRLLAEDVPGDQGLKLIEAADRTPSQGGTNLEEALALASELALKHRQPNGQNRIVLLTDGAANLGNANPERLAQQIDKTRQQGISFDACGVGAKGLNDEILEALTRKGDGRYYFLNKPEDADEGFARQLAGAFRPAAENVKVQVVFNPARVASYRLIGFEKHLLEKQDFRNDKVQAAELSAEEAGVALYQFQPLPEGSGELGEVFVRFRDPATGKMVERSWTMPYDERVPSFDQASPSLQLAATAALLAEKLGGNGQIDLDTLAPVLNGLRGRYGEQQRVGELLRMFEQVRR